MKIDKAHVAGATAAAGVGGGLVGMTASLAYPTANLGGYAVAQMLAGTVGMGGPGLSVAIATVGGPLVVGIAVTGVVGYSAYRVAKWVLK